MEGDLRRRRAFLPHCGDSLPPGPCTSRLTPIEPGRLTTRLAAATAALIAGVVLAFAGAGARATGNVSLTYKQSVASAHFKAIGLEELAKDSGYSKLCWNIDAKGGATSVWCVTRTSQTAAWKLTGKRKGVKVRIERATRRCSLSTRRPPASHPASTSGTLRSPRASPPPTTATGATAARPAGGLRREVPEERSAERPHPQPRAGRLQGQGRRAGHARTARQEDRAHLRRRPGAGHDPVPERAQEPEGPRDLLHDRPAGLAARARCSSA